MEQNQKIWRVDVYDDYEKEYGYSYFVDNTAKLNIKDVFDAANKRLHFACERIVGIREIKRMPSDVGNAYITL